MRPATDRSPSSSDEQGGPPPARRPGPTRSGAFAAASGGGGIRRSLERVSAYVSAFELFSIGVGPSSSHTVGPMRAARDFAIRLREEGLLDRVARVTCTLYGSLGATGIGHGTPDAVVAGLQGLSPETVDPAVVRAAWTEWPAGQDARARRHAAGALREGRHRVRAADEAAGASERDDARGVVIAAPCRGPRGRPPRSRRHPKHRHHAGRADPRPETTRGSCCGRPTTRSAEDSSVARATLRRAQGPRRRPSVSARVRQRRRPSGAVRRARHHDRRGRSHRTRRRCAPMRRSRPVSTGSGTRCRRAWRRGSNTAGCSRGCSR